MYLVRLRFEPYSKGVVFRFPSYFSASQFVDKALTHIVPDKSSNPLKAAFVAEIWEDVDAIRDPDD